jgi:hypothetical protein
MLCFFLEKECDVSQNKNNFMINRINKMYLSLSTPEKFKKVYIFVKEVSSLSFFSTTTV